MYNVRSEGQYRVDGGDWSVNDPDPEAGTYDPEAGDQTSYQDPEAPPPPQPKRHKPKLTVVTSEPQSLFFNTSSLPQDTENTQDIEASSTSNTYSFAQQPHVPSGAKTTKASSSSSSSRIMKDSFGSSLSGGTAPILNASMSPHEAIKQVPHQIRRPLTSRLRVNSSESTESTMGGIGGTANRRRSPQNTINTGSMHPGSDIIWQGCYLWKIPYSSNKAPRVRWVQSVHDVAPNGGRGVYLKWHDPKNTRKQARSLPLSSVAEVVVGQKTNAFFTQVNKR